MNKRGKVFSLGLMLLYIFCAVSALIAIYTLLLADLPETGIGAYQGGLVSAYDRASQKLFYIEQGASDALATTLDLLYADQRAFFTIEAGDGAASLECGAYGYQLWNTGEQDCLLGEPLARILDMLTVRSNEALAATTRQYPDGSFAFKYDVLANTPSDGTRLFVFQTGETLEEPVFLSLPPGASAADVRHAFDGTSVDWLSWPSSGSTTITSCFGPRAGVAAASSNIHKGMDLGPGGQILAAADGVVMNDPSSTRFGTVWIKHSDEYSTGYLHLEDVFVSKDEVVTRGQAIGIAGDTGCAARGCAPHLHFEVLVKEVPGSSSHAYSSPYAPGWYAVNPVCFLAEDELDAASIASSATQSCLHPDYPQPAKSAYCDEYGFVIDESTPVSSETLSEDPPEGLEDVYDLTDVQQDKFSKTEDNRFTHGWGDDVIAASATYGVDQALILGVITQESLGDPLAVSPTGCAGIMQICYNTGLELPGLGAGSMVPCGANCGSSCACTIENDKRLDAQVAIPAGTSYLGRLMNQFSGYTDQLAFAVAAYNGGPGRVSGLIRAVGGTDPSWADVSAYMLAHDIPNTAKAEEIANYVPNVLAYAEAWNGGALDPGRRDRLKDLEEVQKVGTYRINPSVAVEAEDVLTPFIEVVEKAEEILATCVGSNDPGNCLLSEADSAGWSQDCEEPELQYYLEVYQALRDCAENQQRDCKCAMPVPTGDTYTLRFVPPNRAFILDNGSELPGFSFENISLLSSFDELDWDPTLSVEKGVHRDGVLFRLEPSNASSCAPVKNKYAFCKDDLKFALTLRDENAPSVSASYDPDTRMVSLSTTSADVSFYNVYDEAPSDASVPILQLQDTSFDASAYAGSAIYITAVDRAGNEGVAVSVIIPAS